MEKKLKIAIFSGPIEYSICLANALSCFCKIGFFYSERYARRRDESILNLLNSKVEKCPINSYRIRDIRNVRFYYKIAKYLKNYDIIHIQAGDFWLSLWRHIFRDVPIVYTVHDPNQHMGLKKSNHLYQDLVQKKSIFQSAKYVVHGQKLREDLLKRYNISSNDVHILPHGEFSFYKNFQSEDSILNKERKFKRILFFGTIRRNKGLEYLIRAEPLISARFSNFKICIAGNFLGDFDYYVNMIQDKSKFEIINKFIPINQVANLFEYSDLVVLPYVSATQSGVIPIAFGFGKPVVATDVGSIGEVLESGVNGFLIPPCNEKLLANAILEIILSEKKCILMGANARDLAKQKLGWQKIARQTVQIYKSIID